MAAREQEIVKANIRPLQYRDLEIIALTFGQKNRHLVQTQSNTNMINLAEQIDHIRTWYGWLKFLTLFPNPWQNYLRIYIAEELQQIIGLIQVAPENTSRSTWRVKQVLTSAKSSFLETGSQLLRYCFETLWEARTWILEVNVQQNDTLALYRQNGFQPIAHLTYWSLAAENLAVLAEKSAELTNLLPCSNADAQLLYQLDCVSMPPLLRQVFDRHIQDFKTGVLNQAISQAKQWWTGKEIKEYYIFEPQRKAAIAYVNLQISRSGTSSHQLKLTVHPAYTWLYGPVLAKIAQILQNYPAKSLELVSADYQPEREEYLERLSAERIEHTLLMSRSVWHKLREVRQEGLQISDVLQGLNPASRTPVPTRISSFSPSQSSVQGEMPEKQTGRDSSGSPNNGHHA